MKAATLESSDRKTSQTTASRLGGRLPLLEPAELDSDQRELHAIIRENQVGRAKATGYLAMLEDGRLVGPFNALLRAPAVARGLGAWTAAIAQAGAAHFSAVVREVVILTVGAHWQAEYELYAHAIAARRSGLSEGDIASLLDGKEPAGAGSAALIAHRVAWRLVRGMRLDDALYATALGEFGETGLVALLALVGQYMHTSILLNCFEVPAPR